MGKKAHVILSKLNAKAKIEGEIVSYNFCADHLPPGYSNTYVYLGEGTIYSVKGKRTGFPNAKETLHFFRLRNDVSKKYGLAEPIKEVKRKKKNETRKTSRV